MNFKLGLPIKTLIVASWALNPVLYALADVPDSSTTPPGITQPPETSGKNPDSTTAPLRDWQGLPPEERQARRKAMRERWEHMSPDEREALRKKMKEHWEKMKPEERDARRKAMRDRWDNMSPEEREQFRHVMDSQSGK